LIFYQKNIYIVFNTIKTIKQVSRPEKVKLRKNNNELREIIRKDFSRYFKLDMDFIDTDLEIENAAQNFSYKTQVKAFINVVFQAPLLQ
jgi:hypothetical protein